MTKSHLSRENRYTIQHMLESGKSFADIARAIQKNKSTISREVKNHSQEKEVGAPYRSFNDCVNRKNCTVLGNCNDNHCKKTKCVYCNAGCGKDKCSQYERDFCSLLEKPPYVCNGCKKNAKCSLTKVFYAADNAQKEYREILVETRSGVAIGEEEANELSSKVLPLLKNGHSVYSVIQTVKPSDTYCEKTYYNYIAKGVLPGINNAHLPRKVKYKARKSTVHDKVKVDRKCRIGRTFEDYQAYIEKNTQKRIFQMDCVEGKRGDKKAILTLHSVSTHCQFYYILESQSSKCVNDKIDWLYDTLGSEFFCSLFELILTDNGTEFSNPQGIELGPNGERRTSVFYCDPRQSQQKGHCEKNHEHLRQIIPKGTSIQDLTQEDFNLIMDHVNSYPRKSLGGKSPLEMFEFMFGQEAINKLGLKHITTKNIVLAPSLITRS